MPIYLRSPLPCSLYKHTSRKFTHYVNVERIVILNVHKYLLVIQYRHMLQLRQKTRKDHLLSACYALTYILYFFEQCPASLQPTAIYSQHSITASVVHKHNACNFSLPYKNHIASRFHFMVQNPLEMGVSEPIQMETVVMQGNVKRLFLEVSLLIFDVRYCVRR